MVYMAADDSPNSKLPEYGRNSLQQMCDVGSSGDVNIIAQVDLTAEPTRIYYFKKGAQLEDCRLNPGNEYNWDSGNPQILQQFVEWGMSAFPAKHYLLILWGHGTGLDEACYWKPPYDHMSVPGALQKIAHRAQPVGLQAFDLARLQANLEFVVPDYSSGTSVSNPQLAAVLNELKRSTGRGLDVLGFDACVMSMAEVWYEVRDGVSVGVGSEHTIPMSSWPYRGILEALHDDPDMDGRALAKRIVELYCQFYDDPKPGDSVTLAACDLEDAEKLVTATAGLTRALIEALGDASIRDTIIAARLKAQHFFVPDYMDLGHFCEILPPTLPRNSELARACQAVHDIVADKFVLLAASRGRQMRNAHGISIYFPAWLAAPNYRNPRVDAAIEGIATNYGHLQFVHKTGWNHFLLRLLEVFGQGQVETAEEDTMPKQRKPETGGGPLPAGSKFPDGTAKFSDGTTKFPDGTTKFPDGTTKFPDGTTKFPDGTAKFPDGSTIFPDGTTKFPDGTVKFPDGTTKFPDGTTKFPDGTTKFPDGSIKFPDGTTKLPNGAIVSNDGAGNIRIRIEIDLPQALADHRTQKKE
jgi:hypothetical protein